MFKLHFAETQDIKEKECSGCGFRALFYEKMWIYFILK